MQDFETIPQDMGDDTATDAVEEAVVVEEGPIHPVDPEIMIKAREDLSEGVRAHLDELEQEVMKDNKDMTPEDWERELDEMRAGEIEYLERQTKNPDEEVSGRAEFVLAIKKDIDALVDEVNKDVMAGNLDVAEEKVKAFLKDKREYLESLPLEGADVDAALAQMDFLIQLDLTMVQADEKTRSALIMLLSAGIDIIPLVGGAKMMTEAGFGKTLDGRELEGMKRVLHFGEGAFWEVVDVASLALLAAGGSGVVTEGAAVAAKGAKGARAVGTVAKTARAAEGAAKTTRFSEGLMRGGALFGKHSIPGAKSMVRAGKFLEENQKVARVIDETYEIQKAARKAREVKQVKDSASELKESYEQRMALIDQINEEREKLTDILENLAGQLDAA